MTNENSKRKELDFRFADEMDGIDIHKFIHLVVKNVEQNESSPFYFRNKDSDSIITFEEVLMIYKYNYNIFFNSFNYLLLIARQRS